MSIKDHTRKLYCSEPTEGFQQQRLKKNVYLAQLLVERQKDGEGPTKSPRGL
jgi:hypothetical protein